MKNIALCCLASAVAIFSLFLFPIGLGKIATGVFSVSVMGGTSPALIATTLIVADIVLVLIVISVFVIALLLIRRHTDLCLEKPEKLGLCCLASAVAIFTLFLFPIGLSILLDSGVRALGQIDANLSVLVNSITLLTIIIISLLIVVFTFIISVLLLRKKSTH